MKMIDPTYLRTIHDGLLLGTIHKDNASNLPIGLIGIYEEALPPASNVNERKKFLEFFAVWALLKKELSVAFLMALLEGWSEENIIYYINKYSKWFNSPQSGKYVLYHERLRAFVLQKISKQQFNTCNETIIKVAHDALSRRSGDEWENYALEYLSNHMLIPAIEKGDGTVLKLLAYNTTHWNRQVEISKGFEWSKRMLNDMMLWASKYDDEEVIECALNKVDLHHQEQNDAPRIVELVAQNDIATALDRIDKFGGQDKEGLQRKFILYMLCLLELTLLESKDKPFRKEAIEKLLKHLDDNLPVDHSVLNWNDFFPSYLMFLMACDWAELGLDYLILYKRTNDWEKNWLSKKSSYVEIRFDVLLKCAQVISDDYEKSISLKDISTELARQGKVVEASATLQEALVCLEGISSESDKSRAIKDISAELAKQGKVDEALACARGIPDERDRSSAQTAISTELAKQGKVNEALACARDISDESDKISTLINISTELTTNGKTKEALECARGISDNLRKSNIFASISSELTRKGHISQAKAAIREAISFAGKLKDVSEKSSALLFISIELRRQGKLSEAEFTLHEALNQALQIVDIWQMCYALNKISSELCKQGYFEIALEYARVISEPYWKSPALTNIASELENQGKSKIAAQILHEAHECSMEIKHVTVQSRVLKDISIELVKHGKVEKAMEIVRGISKDSEKRLALQASSIELVKQGKIDEVLKVISGMNDEECKFDTIQSIISELANRGKLEIGLECAQLMQNEPIKSFALAAISIELVKQGKIAAAIAAVLGIRNDREKSSALLANSAELVKQQMGKEAIECARSIRDNTYMNRAIQAISNAMAIQGLFEEVAYAMKVTLESHGLCQDETKGRATAMIAHEFVKIGEVENALACARSIGNAYWRDSAMEYILLKFVKQGNIKAAMECTEALSSDFKKSIALKDISRELRVIGKIELSTNTISKAIVFAMGISDNSDKTNAIKVISTELVLQGNFEKALECVHKIKIEWRRVLVLKAIACQLIEQEKIKEAYECVHGIPDEFVKCTALAVISNILWKQEKFGEAEIAMREAISLIQEKIENCKQYLASEQRDSIFDVRKFGIALKEIAIELDKQGRFEYAKLLMQDAIFFMRDVSPSVLKEIATELVKQVKFEEALACAQNISSEYWRSSAYKDISTELANNGKWALAEYTGLLIHRIAERQSCWEIIGKNTFNEKGWLSALQFVNQFQHEESQRYYLKGIADSATPNEAGKEQILSARSFYMNDLESINKLLQHHALHEVFFNDVSPEKIERFNRTLNIQWALDIKNQFT